MSEKIIVPLRLSSYYKKYKVLSISQRRAYANYIRYLNSKEVLTDEELDYIEDIRTHQRPEEILLKISSREKRSANTQPESSSAHLALEPSAQSAQIAEAAPSTSYFSNIPSAKEFLSPIPRDRDTYTASISDLESQLDIESREATLLPQRAEERPAEQLRPKEPELIPEPELEPEQEISELEYSSNQEQESETETQTTMAMEKMSVLKAQSRLTKADLSRYKDLINQLLGKSSHTEEETAFIVDYMKTLSQIDALNLPDELPTSFLNLSISDTNITIKLNELVVKPSIFNGTIPRPRKWLEDFEDAIESNGWNDKVVIKYFKTWLEGSAKDWYITQVRPNLTANSTWTDISTMFHQQYLSGDKQKLMHYIEMLNQRPNEPVETFLPKVRRAILSLNPQTPMEEQVRKISEKLRPEYRKDVIIRNPKTIDELHDLCTRIEIGIAASGSRRFNTPFREAPKFNP